MIGDGPHARRRRLSDMADERVANPAPPASSARFWRCPRSIARR
jgi:hypothetical protein